MIHGAHGNEKGPVLVSGLALLIGSGGKTRTCDKSVNSRLLYQLSYAGSGVEARTGIEPVYTALQAAA